MSKVWLATGFDHGYLAKAEPYLASLRKHEPYRTTVFTVDFEPGQDIGLRHQFVDYKKCLQVDKKMLQNGGFVTQPPPHWREDDVVAFTDADVWIQRPLAEGEIELFERETVDGGVMIGRNKNDPRQTLADEATALFPQRGWERVLINCDKKLCRNTGFLVARLGTWRELYRDFVALWPIASPYFLHYARVQMLICWIVQSDGKYRLRDLPLTIHAQAHHGMPPEVEIGADGVARVDGKVIFLRHVL